MRSGRHISAILSAAAALLMTLGCVKEPVKVPIAVAPSVLETKALVGSDEGLRTNAFSLLATLTNGRNTSAAFGNDKLYYDATNSSWTYDIPKYWVPQSHYTFGAFWPYASSAESQLTNGTVTYSADSGTPTLTITGYNTGKGNTFDARSEDLLYTTYSRDNTAANDYSPVPLQMGHLLSCLSFQVRNATSNPVTHITDISLTGLKYKFDLSVTPAQASITPDGAVVGTDETYFSGEERSGDNTTPFLPAGMSEAQFKPLYACTDLTVLPQDVYGNAVVLKFTVHFSGNSSGTEYSANLGTIESLTRWYPGKRYLYNFTISSKDILFQVSEVEWIEHNIKL
jgi:hypothetical protein